MGQWLTPDHAPGTLMCRALFFPDSVDWLAIVAGALLPLTYASSFEQYGTATPAETAEVFRQTFDSFSFNDGVCRVIGEIVTFAGSTNPNPGQWLLCDGASLDRATYTELFTCIGTTYGSVDSSHFNLPDLRGRTIVGVGTGSGLTPAPWGTPLEKKRIHSPRRKAPATSTRTRDTHMLKETLHLLLLLLVQAFPHLAQYPPLVQLLLLLLTLLQVAEMAAIIIFNHQSR